MDTMLTVLLAATAMVPQLPEAQVPAAPVTAVAPAVPVLDPQMPVGQIHSSGVTLERTMTGARHHELQELSLPSMAMVAFAPEPQPVRGVVASITLSPTAIKPYPQAPVKQLPFSAAIRSLGSVMSPAGPGAFAHQLSAKASPMKVALASEADRAVFAESTKLVTAEASSGKLLKEIELGTTIRSVSLSADGRRAAVVMRSDRTNDYYLASVDLETGESVERRQTDFAAGLTSSPSGNVTAHVGPNGTLHLWNRELETTRTYDARLNTSMDAVLAFSKDGTKLAVGAHGGVYLLDLRAGTREYFVYSDRYATTHQIALADDGRTVAAADDDGFVHVWSLDAKTHATFPTLSSNLEGLAFDGPDALVWLDKLGRYGRARFAKIGAVAVEFSKAHDPEQLWAGAVRADVAVEGRAKPNARVRLARLKAPAPKAAAQAAAEKKEPEFAAPAPADPLGEAYADIMARFEIAQAGDVVPRLSRWLTADLEIFRLAARKNLQRLAALGDPRARVIMEAWTSTAESSNAASSHERTPGKAKTSPRR